MDGPTRPLSPSLPAGSDQTFSKTSFIRLLHSIPEALLAGGPQTLAAPHRGHPSAPLPSFAASGLQVRTATTTTTTTTGAVGSAAVEAAGLAAGDAARPAALGPNASHYRGLAACGPACMYACTT
eukprot:scaffold115853_cov18-Tisochrysis_lutea.AAC.1